MPLHVVPPAPKPPETAVEKAARRIRVPKPPELLECHRCAGREFMETKVGVLFVNGRTRGGTKQLLCASCFMRGERVKVA